jgi:tetratricopeptide (TPR) repeat protein
MNKYLFMSRALVFFATSVIFSSILPAHADGLTDSGKLLQQGQTQQALAKVDGYLAVNPQDASGRFLRGVILTEMNRSNDAITMFTKLTEDYPNLPEPYNNLAVLYAQLKQYDKAKSALEAAIRINPAYATAHENLGDIYARLAAQAYDKALLLDSANTTAQKKQTMIRNLFTTSSGAASPVTTATPAPTVTVQPIPSVIAATVQKAEPTGQNVNPTSEASDDPENLIRAWADAWSHKDFKAYITCYASSFKPPKRQSRAAWETEREQRVTKPGEINVTVENMHVTSEGPEQVVIEFRQHYKSPSLSSSDNKSLLMIKENGQWKILQERVKY